MEKIRICDLKMGDMFEMDGQRWRVEIIDNGRVYFRRYNPGEKKWRRGWGSDIGSRGAESVQFVNLEKRAHEKKEWPGSVETDIRAEEGADGSAAD
jgi:hypothetical protein